MGKEARSGNVATMGVHQLEDSACLLWVVTAHGVCLLLGHDNLVLYFRPISFRSRLYRRDLLDRPGRCPKPSVPRLTLCCPGTAEISLPLTLENPTLYGSDGTRTPGPNCST